MSAEKPNLVHGSVCRGRQAVFICLFGLDCLSIGDFGFQVSIQVFKLVSPLLEYSRCGGLGGWVQEYSILRHSRTYYCLLFSLYHMFIIFVISY